MDYDSWLWKQVDDHYGYDDCEEDEDCECVTCVNRKKFEYEEAEADARHDSLWENEHCFEFINGRPR